MERRDFVRRSGVAVTLLSGCLGGEETPESDDGNTEATEDGSDEDSGNRTEGDGGEDDEEGDEEGDTGEEDAGYTRFMYDPEPAGVDADGYVFTYTDTGASEELYERVHGVEYSAGRTARVEIRGTEDSSESGEGGLPERDGREIVDVRVYEQQSSYEELRGSLTEPIDSHADYEIYETRRAVWGVKDDELTVVEGPTADRIRLVVETLEGETPPYTESSDDVRVLTDVVGTGDAVQVRGELPEVDTPGVEGAIASAFSLSEDGETVSLRYAVVYPDEDGANAAVSTEASQEIPEDEDGMTPLLALTVTELRLRVEDVEVSNRTVNGRVAVLEASVDRDAFFGGR